MNRTRGFINLNRFKSGKMVKKLKRVPDRHGLEKRSELRNKLSR